MTLRLGLRPRSGQALVALLVTTIAVIASPALDAYLVFGGSTKWKTLPVRYFITNRDVPGVTAQQLQAAAGAAFATWAAVPTATLSSEFVGFTSADPGPKEGMTVIGFLNRPDLERVLGQTTFRVDTTTGQLSEADIFLNTSFDWSVSATGQAQRFDAQSILTHEIGHLLGLAHSALGETRLDASGGRAVLGKRAVMFPIAYPSGNIDDRTVKDDDIAGISNVYPTTEFTRRAGAIAGNVTLNGTGIFGAHVTATNSATGVLVGGFSLDAQGKFTINGLEPGLYVVRVEPLDDADTTSFFTADANVNINFKAAYYSKLVAVPEGGSGPSISIKVVAK